MLLLIWRKHLVCAVARWDFWELLIIEFEQCCNVDGFHSIVCEHTYGLSWRSQFGSPSHKLLWLLLSYLFSPNKRSNINQHNRKRCFQNSVVFKSKKILSPWCVRFLSRNLKKLWLQFLSSKTRPLFRWEPFSWISQQQLWHLFFASCV